MRIKRLTVCELVEAGRQAGINNLARTAIRDFRYNVCKRRAVLCLRSVYVICVRK